ncbi:hypothetical protein [Streptomyces sp. NPDC006463]|uniref:hypothetical protein n=1 Tax=Streptomyces sp. NPDC006463 TaxID=3364746 RepID=UPI003693E860
MDAQGEAVAVQDVEHVEDVPGAAHQAEHLGDVHSVARPRVRERLAELRPLQRVKAAGGPGLLLEDNRVLDPGLVQHQVLAVGRLLVGRIGGAAGRRKARIHLTRATPVVIRSFGQKKRPEAPWQ